MARSSYLNVVNNQFVLEVVKVLTQQDGVGAIHQSAQHGLELKSINSVQLSKGSSRPHTWQSERSLPPPLHCSPSPPSPCGRPTAGDPPPTATGKLGPGPVETQQGSGGASSMKIS